MPITRTPNVKGNTPVWGTAANPRDPRHRQPCWSTFYDLGVRINKLMQPINTLDHVGAQLGVTKQNAGTEVFVALGKLAWHAFHSPDLREHFHEQFYEP